MLLDHFPGHRQGMTGGRVIIDGSVGALAGGKMRRGLLAIEETQGKQPASNFWPAR